MKLNLINSLPKNNRDFWNDKRRLVQHQAGLHWGIFNSHESAQPFGKEERGKLKSVLQEDSFNHGGAEDAEK
jgi:hypothetical protein